MEKHLSIRILVKLHSKHTMLGLYVIEFVIHALHVVVILFNLGGNLMLWVKFDLNHLLCVNVLTFATLFT